MFGFRILVDVPALDRLVNYLIGLDQAKIDPLTQQIQQLTARLNAANAKLKTAASAAPGAQGQ